MIEVFIKLEQVELACGCWRFIQGKVYLGEEWHCWAHQRKSKVTLIYDD